MQDLTTELVRELLGMKDKPPCCPKAASVHLAHKTRKGVGAVARLGCKSWACLGCSGRLRLAYGQSLALHFMNSTRPVRETTCGESEWASMKNRLNYLKADYVKVADRDGWYTVLHTGETCDRPLTVMEAITRLGELLRGVQHTGAAGPFRPVVSSRGWKLPSRASEYEYAGLVPYANPDKVRKALEDDGARVRKVDTDGGNWMLTYQKDDGPADLSKKG